MIAAPLAMLVAIRPLLSGLGWAARRGASPGRRWPSSSSPAPSTRASSPSATRRSARPGTAPSCAPSCRSSTASRSSTRARTATPPTSCSAPTPTCRWSSSPTRTSPQNLEKPFDTGDAYSPIDFDSFSRSTLNRFPYVITGRAAWNSEAPPSFRRIAATPSYILWERTAPPPARPPRAARGDRAGGLRRLRRAGDPHPHRQPRPRLALPGRRRRAETRAGAQDSVLGTGESATQTLDLPAGRWLLSLQYFSPFDLTLSAPGFSEPLEAALDGQRPNTISLANNGQFWPAGRVRERRRPGRVHDRRRRGDRDPEPHRLGRQGDDRRAGRRPRRAPPDRAAAARPAAAGSTGTKPATPTP